jgi:putative nucleotidyltransferase with HDIG domain
MKPAEATATIDVDALRVGMFVHLDIGWMSHPFPRGSFRIADPAQIATIRSLGLARVRLGAAQSDPAALPATAETEAPGVGALPPAAIPFVDPAAAERAEHRQRLREQRAALALCEARFAEAAGACRKLNARVLSEPHAARDDAQALAAGLVDKMLVPGDLCIRLLTTAAGDKASVHALNVTVIALLMGRAFGLPRAELEDLGVGALLHDIGKLEPERGRHRDGPLGSAEQRLDEDHVARGVAMAGRMGLTGGATLVVAQHHEHADGSGFPLRLNIDRMSPGARIVALVNRYDNLCNPPRPSEARTPHESLSLLFAQGKTKFDTAVLGAFIKMMGVYPPGSVVQLTDDRMALVVGMNSSRPLRPQVLIHQPGVSRDEALIVDLERTPALGIRRSVKVQALPDAALQALAPRPRVSYFFEPVGVGVGVDVGVGVEATLRTDKQAG